MNEAYDDLITEKNKIKCAHQKILKRACLFFFFIDIIV